MSILFDIFTNLKDTLKLHHDILRLPCECH